MIRTKLKDEYGERGPTILKKILDEDRKFIESYELTTLSPLPEELQTNLSYCC